MTDEGQEHGPDDTPAPPASTRWSEDAAEDSDAIAPPFVPGRAAPAPTPAPAGERASAAGDEIEPATVSELEAEPVDATGAEETEPAEGADFPFEPGSDADEDASSPAGGSSEDDFPFEEFDIEGAGEAEAVEPSESPGEGVGAPYADEPDVAGTAWSPADFGQEEPLEEAPGGEAESEVEGEPELVGEAEAATFGEAEPEAEVEPDLAGAAGSGWVPGPGSAPAAAGGGAAEEAADLLDRLAGMLRTEGEAAVRREMDSDDRLTAVLAGLLAGYVSGRS